jgi:hypothetical protein
MYILADSEMDHIRPGGNINININIDGIGNRNRNENGNGDVGYVNYKE